MCVVYRGRAVPVGWRVLAHRSSSVALWRYQDLLERVAGLMPPGVKVVLLADRGFVDAQLCRYVHQSLKWHYRIRMKASCWFWGPGRGWKQIQSVHLSRGEAWLIQQVWVHKTDCLKGVYLALAHAPTGGEYWYILSSEPTTLQTFREYGLRFDIEENFLDDKSNGFELEDSMLRSAAALSRLCLVLAVATLYLTLQGTAVVAQGKRRLVDSQWFRGSSYLKLGWNWVKAALARGWSLLHSTGLITQHDPDPAMASKIQHQRQRYRLEFTVGSVDFPPG